MSWGAILGQSLAVRLLRQAVTGGKVAHAYLLVGPDGVGKRTIALELAKALNCQAPMPDGSACDNCLSCRKFAAEPPAHPDLMIVTPEGRFIKTDQMRALQAEMYARPTEGKVRVAMIDGADRMNPEAGNRLLKLLEEPPAYAVLLLLTHNLSGVLPTLISRCQVVHCPPLSPHEVAGALETRHAMEGGRARLFAALSGGSIGRAVRMAHDPAVLQRRDETGEVLSKVREMDDFTLLSLAEALEKQKENLDDWLDLLIVWLRDALLVTQAADPSLLINADRPGVVRWAAEAYSAGQLLEMLAAVTDARRSLQRNANARLVLDVMLLRIHTAAHGS